MSVEVCDKRDYNGVKCGNHHIVFHSTISVVGCLASKIIINDWDEVVYFVSSMFAVSVKGGTHENII